VRPIEANQVRAAEAGDIAALGSLMIEFYAEGQFSLSRVAAERTFAALSAAPNMGQVWLLESAGRPAGFVVLTVSFTMEYGGLRGFVDDFFVLRQCRRQGLGARALQAIKEECVRRGVKALLVETSLANAEALSVYQRAGFVDTGHLLMKIGLGEPLHTVERRDAAAEGRVE
jgi:GNAT superfamily N-acetyltransferase